MAGLPARSAVIYVNATAPGPAHNGAGWTTAFLKVQAAIDAAGASDEIHVAQGNYAEHITLRADISVFGGYAGSGSKPDDHSVHGHLTVLNGGGSGGAVVNADSSTSAAVLDGFTVTGGDAGGIHLADCSPTIRNNVVQLNSNGGNGGAIYATGGSPLITNNTIIGNTATGLGGGIYLGGPSATVANNTIARNTSQFGGGVFEENAANAKVVNNTIVENTDAGNGSGALFAREDLVFVNNIVAFNSSGLSWQTTDALSNHNLVYANTTGDYGGAGQRPADDINADPQIVRDVYGNYHTQPASPARNAGFNAAVVGSTDIDGEARIQQGIVDIGADESNNTATLTDVEPVQYVKPDGSDANDGSSWATAKKTVQAACDANAALGGEVWVKSGVYPEHVAIARAVALYGGFAGTESNRSQRPDPRLSPSVIDGGGSAFPVATFATGAPPSTTLDGFTITGGGGGSGGGANFASASPVIRNNLFRTNNSTGHGGAIYVSAGAPLITNNTIVGNTATGFGGGIYLTGSSATLANNSIARNSAQFGGGIFEESGGDPRIVNNTIVENGDANNGSGALYGRDDVTFVNNIIAFNTSGLFWQTTDVHSTHNLVFANTDGDYTGAGTAPADNVVADPLLARDAYGNYHIQPGSPARNAGLNSAAVGTTDIDGEPRIQQGTVDIGADETNGSAAFVDVEPVVYVRPAADGGNDSNSGASWATAKATTQAGLNSLVLGGQVWVAAGTYKESGVTLGVGKSLYGGFLGTEAALSQRSNPRLHPTIVDAGGAAISVLVVPPGVGVTSTVDGFTFVNATAGSGIQMTNSSAAIRNNTVHGIASPNNGAGISVTGGAPLIASNTITGNSTGTFAGGVYLSATQASLANNVIAHNSAQYGGGLFEENGGTPTVVNNTIVDNSSVDPTSGGAYIRDDVTFVNNVVAFNTSGTFAQVANTRSRSNLYFGNTGGDLSGAATSQSGDVLADPLFMDHVGSDYHLATGSPAVDAGHGAEVTGAVDVRAGKRVVGAQVDIGAYELQADLAVKETVSDANPVSSAPVTYTLSIANNGPDPATTVRLSDNLPANLTNVSVTSAGGGTAGGAGNSPNVTFPTLAPGATATVTIQATVDCAVPNGAVITNTASIATVAPPAVPTPDPDATNNATSASLTVNNPVPVVTNVTASPAILLKANHRMVTVTVNYTAADNCDPNPVNALSAVSNEADSGTGPGDLAGDIVVVDAHHIQLRAERAGSAQARVYTVTVLSKDAGNGIGTQSVTVTVPVPTLANARQALRIAGGLLAGSAADLQNLDAERDGRLDLLDAVRFAREATGLEP